MTISPERMLAIGVGVVLLAVGGLAFARMAYIEANGIDEIEYRGETIRLAKKYIDYDAYKNDANNLAASEIPRIERMMTAAPLGPDFASWKNFAEQFFAIKFPGYGAVTRPEIVSAGRRFVAEVIEIPQVAKERYLVVEKKPDGTLRLVDDFVAPRKPGSPYGAIYDIRLVDGRLVYSDHKASVVRETSIAP